MKKSTMALDRVLAALTIILALVVMLMLLLHYPQYQAPAGSAARPPTPANAALPQQVQLDYLYADWCSYCTLTHPAVVSVAMRFGPAVSLNEYNEALRTSDPQVASLYADYKKRGVFTLFPTIVAHGPRGESALGGMQTEDNIQKWLCAQYTQAPAPCKTS
ncbi:Uncharacterised protein [uncultured archaeon]|nr:Uncharacterised protein [uncultured archaeon]